MNFDPATLLTTAIFTLLLIGVVLAGMVKNWKRDAAEIWWAAAFLSAGIGFSVFTWNAEPVYLPRLVANTLFLLASSCCYNGARALAGRQTKIWPVIIALAGWPILIGVVEPGFESRVIILSLAVSGYFAVTSIELARGAKPVERIRFIASAICIGHAIFYLARALFGPALGLVDSAFDTTVSVWGAIVAFEATLFLAALGTLVVGISSERSNARERFAANTDFLTGIGNRRAFNAAILPLIRDVKEDAPPVLLLLDLDNFKEVNDRLGHIAGDEFLKTYAFIARKQLVEPDLFWRLGGDEFAIVLREAELGEVEMIKSSLRRAVDSCLTDMRAKAGIQVSVSIGCAVMASGENLLDLLRRGDTALYRDKNNVSALNTGRKS